MRAPTTTRRGSPLATRIRSRVLAGALLATLIAPGPALAHQGNPHYLSQVDEITPATPGVTVEVLNRDDRLLLHNTSGEDVVIEGYDEEPYARVRADGTVEVNTDSEAYYVNDDRFGNVDVPAGVDGKGPPRWKEIDKTGRFEWHDHRAHWMGHEHAAAGDRHVGQVEGLRLEGAGGDRRGRGARSAGRCSGPRCPAAVRRSARSSRAPRS